MTDGKNDKKHGRKTVAGNEDAVNYLCNLKSFRESKGLSQMKLAQLSGVSDKTIRAIELHHIKPHHVSVVSYLKLAQFFGWAIDASYDYAPVRETKAQEAPEKSKEVEVQDTTSYNWKDNNSEMLKVNASKMYHMLNRIASENQVWTVGEVKRLLASVSKGLGQLG